MKKNTIFKLVLTAAALFLLTFCLLYITRQSEDDRQSVSLVIEHFPKTEDAPNNMGTAHSQNISPSVQDETAVGINDIDDGFDLADELYSIDFYLEQIKDFQTKVESEAKRRQELAESNSTVETEDTDYYNYFDNAADDNADIR